MNGHASNGHASNGHAANGHAANGHTTPSKSNKNQSINKKKFSVFRSDFVSCYVIFKLSIRLLIFAVPDKHTTLF